MKKLVIERTLQCTEIIEVPDNRVDDYVKDYRGDHPERNREFADTVKYRFGLDNCIVTNAQVFVTEGEKRTVTSEVIMKLSDCNNLAMTYGLSDIQRQGVLAQGLIDVAAIVQDLEKENIRLKEELRNKEK